MFQSNPITITLSDEEIREFDVQDKIKKTSFVKLGPTKYFVPIEMSDGNEEIVKNILGEVLKRLKNVPFGSKWRTGRSECALVEWPAYRQACLLRALR